MATSILIAALFFGTYVLAHYGVHWVFCVVPIYLAYVLQRTREKDLLRAQRHESARIRKREMSVEDLQTLYPEKETVSWLNGVVSRMWPHFEPSLSRSMSQSVLKQLLKKVPVYVTDVYFERFSLGEIPPSFLSVYYHASKGDLVVIDVHVSFRCEGDILLRVKFGPKLLQLNVPILVQDVKMHGRIRFEAQFMKKAPFVQIAKVSFIETPDLDFTLRPLVVVDVQYIPGIKGWVHTALLSKISSRMVWPTKLVLPIGMWAAKEDEEQGGGEGRPTLPSGILHVTVHRARDLEACMGETCSPYLACRVDTQEHNTATLTDTTQPEWSQEFDFVVREEEDFDASLHVTVYHDGGEIALGFVDIDLTPHLLKSKEMGSGPGELGPVDAGSNWYQLQGTEVGEVFLGIYFEPMKIHSGRSINKVLKKIAHLHTHSHTHHHGHKGSRVFGSDTISSWSSRKMSTTDALMAGQGQDLMPHFLGTLTFNLLAGADLMPADRNGLSDPYALIEVGSMRYKSRIHKKTLNPNWQEQFIIPLDETSKQLGLRIRIKDNNLVGSNTPIGDTYFDLATLNPGDHIEQWVDLDNADTGRIHYEMFWKEKLPAADANGNLVSTPPSVVVAPGQGPGAEELATSAPVHTAASLSPVPMLTVSPPSLSASIPARTLSHSESTSTGQIANYHGRVPHHPTASSDPQLAVVRDPRKVTDIQCIGCELRAVGPKRKVAMTYKFLVNTEPAMKDTWVFQRSFKHFETLHSKLKALASDASIVSLPKLPPKKMFKQHAKLGTSLDASKYGGRNPMDTLQMYLMQVLSCDQALQHYHFHAFLDETSSLYGLN